MIINERWATNFPNAKCINEVAVGSDHAPLVLTMDEGRRRRVRNFWFEEMWLENSECKEVIQGVWEENNCGVRQGNYGRNWEGVGGVLKAWSKERFDNNMNEMRKAKDRLKTIGLRHPIEETSREETELMEYIKELWR